MVVVVDRQAVIVAATGTLAHLEGMSLLEHFVLRLTKDGGYEYREKTQGGAAWRGTVNVLPLKGLDYRLCVFRPYLDDCDAAAVGSLKHVNPASKQREIETRSFFSINDASWVSIITVCMPYIPRQCPMSRNGCQTTPHLASVVRCRFRGVRGGGSLGTRRRRATRCRHTATCIQTTSRPPPSSTAHSWSACAPSS
jgi:hypothetical protein